MAETNMLFTLQQELFNEIWRQSDDLLGVRYEFAMRSVSLSRSLLAWETDRNWRLADFGNEKVYHIETNNDEVEVSEETGGWGLGSNPAHLLSFSTVYGTQEGFIDWLRMLGEERIDQSRLDGLKRTDLSGRRFSFEIVQPDLSAAYEMLQEILTAPRESLVGLSKDNIHQIRDYLRRWLDRFEEIHTFNPERSSREEHKGLLQEIVNFCDEVKGQLGPIVAYLQSKKAEQLETQVKATVEDTVTDAEEKLSAETDRLQKQVDQSEQNEVKRQEDFNQLKDQMQDLLARESVSEYGTIFEEQANEHKGAARGWLISTVVLSIGFGGVFIWLFNVLRLGGTEWVGVLQNIFTKGFLLSLIYLLLNRSIKNYTAQKHLEVINRHRQNALDTFERFVSSAARQETKEEVLLAATNAIFDANQSGYLSAKMKGNENVSPILQVIKAFTPRASSTRSE